jgi:hypothetical protein
MTQPCTCTLGFTGSADISVVSVLPNQLCTVGYGVQLVACLYNLSCPTPEPGEVCFYWVPLGWTNLSATLPVPTPDAITNSNCATAYGPNGLLNITEGQPPFAATVCWVPTVSQIGNGTVTKGNILALATSLGNGQCQACTAPNYNPPYAVLSGRFPIYASPSVWPSPPPPPAPPEALVLERDSRRGGSATLVHVGFVLPNPSPGRAKIDVVVSSIGAGGNLPVGNRPIPGSSRLTNADVRVGLGRHHSRIGEREFMAQFHTGVLEAAVFQDLLSAEGLSPHKEVRLEPGEVLQGLLEVEFPDHGNTLATCALNVAYVLDGQRVDGFSLTISSNGTFL